MGTPLPAINFESPVNNLLYLVFQAVTWKVKTKTLQRTEADSTMPTIRGRVYRPRDGAAVPALPPRGEVIKFALLAADERAVAVV